MLILHTNFYKELAVWRDATGLSVPSPRPAALALNFAVGFPLLSLADEFTEASIFKLLK